MRGSSLTAPVARACRAYRVNYGTVLTFRIKVAQQFSGILLFRLVVGRMSLAIMQIGARGAMIPDVASGRVDDRLEIERDVPLRVRHEIRAALAAGPRLPDAARRLGMSPATLQRRLQARGLTFAALVRDIRQELAMVHLAGADPGLAELAAQLGYSELSAFSRAFRAWTGLSPAAWRRRAIGG